MWGRDYFRRLLGVSALERKQETMMAELDDLQTSETSLEGAVTDALAEITVLNAQLQHAVANNNSAAIAAVAGAMDRTTARIRAALPADHPLNQEAEPRPVSTATDGLTTAGQPAAIQETMAHTGADPQTAEVQLHADLAANASTANGLNVAMAHPQASEADLAHAASGEDPTAGADPNAPSLAETLPAQSGGPTTREDPNVHKPGTVNGEPVEDVASVADPNAPVASGPAPTPESLGEVDANGDPAPNTTR